MEDLVAINGGYRRFGFSDLVLPCGFGSNRVGIQNSAEWVRTAFHDAITHNASAGTGGLDASILFEMDRPENTGAAFNNTFGAMSGFVNIRSSAADVIAVALVLAVTSCGGPSVPLRFGRVDATEAGPAGVPKPEDDLPSTQTRFSTAGFTQTDMISMVACGHSLGNIHSVDFPQLVSGNASEANIATFDKTPASFDNAVVVEYLTSNTSNPLVVGTNSTTNSDMRIFSSDANTTMSTLSDSATFRQTCANIFERMINTVPSTVTLSEPLELRDIKPYFDKVQLQADGSISIVGSIRVRTTTVTGRNPNDLAVTLPYTTRTGLSSDSQVIKTTLATLKGGQSSGFNGESFHWFEFSQAIDGSAGIAAFNVSMSSISTGNTTLYDNSATGGYPLTAEILYQPGNSCLVQVTDGFRLQVVAAVRKELIDGGASVSMEVVRKVPYAIGILLPRLVPESIPMTQVPSLERSGYVYFQGNTTLANESWSTTFDISVTEGAQTFKVEFQKTTGLPSTCGALS
ncbi:heme peroxidase [Thozetella sp. PMI_491]|nr:heme peroxidase [Thozetella sp. PMI_491]